MTVKQAIKIIDWWINHKQKTMERFKTKWYYDTFDEATEVEKVLFDMDMVEIQNLQTIRKELVPNCKHPKKMRDRAPNGQWYCMNCNLDL